MKSIIIFILLSIPFISSAQTKIFGNAGYNINGNRFYLINGTDTIASFRADSIKFYKPTNIVGSVALSGTYTPTLTSNVNLTSSSISVCQYMRVGNVVTVSGKLTVDYTASGNASVNISLPIGSSLVNDFEVAGVASSNTTVSGVIRADASADTAQFFITSGTSGGDDFFFTFTYIIQ
jgi:hypothetical protein